MPKEKFVKDFPPNVKVRVERTKKGIRVVALYPEGDPDESNDTATIGKPADDEAVTPVARK